MNFVKLNDLINEAIERQNQRSQKIILGRYGLDTDETKTLAELGEGYDLTRERIRQIQEVVMQTLRTELLNHKEITSFLKFLHNHLNQLGNLRPSHLLAKDIMQEATDPRYGEKVSMNRLHFIGELLNEPKLVYGDNDWNDLWHNDPRAHTVAKKVVEHLLTFNDHDFDKFMTDAKDKFSLSEKVILNYLHASKHFGQGPYGDLGADSWVHVNPKTARDKNYLVLKKIGKPLHFREIANLVNNLKDIKPSHPDTIHNELIKDDRFVLVGRGMYALREQ